MHYPLTSAPTWKLGKSSESDLDSALEPITGIPAAEAAMKKGGLLRAGHLILEGVGEDTRREGLLRTPERFSKAMTELTAGYELTLQDVVGEGVFASEGQGLVSVRDVEFHSLCEHHLIPFWGSISVAYYPKSRIVGLSKIPRIVEMYSRRFQVQERLTREVAEALFSVVEPRAVVVRAKAAHMCMMMRGVKKQNSETVTEFALGLDNLTPDERARLWASVDESR